MPADIERLITSVSGHGLSYSIDLVLHIKSTVVPVVSSPRLFRAFQRCTLKSWRVWYAKSHEYTLILSLSFLVTSIYLYSASYEIYDVTAYQAHATVQAWNVGKLGMSLRRSYIHCIYALLSTKQCDFPKGT